MEVAKQYLSVKEATKLIGVSKTTIFKQIKSGKF